MQDNPLSSMPHITERRRNMANLEDTMVQTITNEIMDVLRKHNLTTKEANQVMQNAWNEVENVARLAKI
jgi:uncharacterized protein YejL (UPF0352 family)